jgi:hypothetical protein
MKDGPVEYADGTGGADAEATGMGVVPSLDVNHYTNTERFQNHRIDLAVVGLVQYYCKLLCVLCSTIASCCGSCAVLLQIYSRRLHRHAYSTPWSFLRAFACLAPDYLRSASSSSGVGQEPSASAPARTSRGNWISNTNLVSVPEPEPAPPPKFERQTSSRVITSAEQTGEAVLVAIEGNIRVKGEIRGKRNAVRAKLEVISHNVLHYANQLLSLYIVTLGLKP